MGAGRGTGIKQAGGYEVFRMCQACCCRPTLQKGKLRPQMRRGLAAGHADKGFELLSNCLPAGLLDPLGYVHCPALHPPTDFPFPAPMPHPLGSLPLWTLQSLSHPHLARTPETEGGPSCLALSPSAWGSLAVRPGAKVALGPSIVWHGTRHDSHQRTLGEILRMNQ